MAAATSMPERSPGGYCAESRRVSPRIAIRFPKMLTRTTIVTNPTFHRGLSDIAIAPTMVTPTELMAEPMSAIELVNELVLDGLLSLVSPC